MSERQEVWITSAGVASSLGLRTDATWDALSPGVAPAVLHAVPFLALIIGAQCGVGIAPRIRGRWDFSQHFDDSDFAVRN